MIDFILFDGSSFPIRMIEFPNIGVVNISTHKLNDIIMSENGSYSSIEAEMIDEQVFYYVAEEHLDLDTNSLIKLISKSI